MKIKAARIAPVFLAGMLAGMNSASATEGYFALGYGPVQRALGGAGVAHPTDAMSAAVNPAAAARVGHEFNMGIEAFVPLRGYDATGTFFVPPGSVDSGRTFFLVPNMAYNRPISGNSALNFSIYGNGGMNTSYGLTAAGCGSTYCGGPAGVDLTQAFMSATYAVNLGNVSLGIAPTIAIQAFEARGLGAFAPVSADPANLTDRGHDWSFGAGLRAGVIFDVSETFRIGLAGQTPMWMSRFSKYRGLFAEGGSFDIPASVTAGFAWDIKPNLTVMFDYQHIFYGGVASVSNPFSPNPLGSPNGPGFGWDDVDVFKVGVEWRQNEKFTWRAGYAFSTNPVGSEDVTLGILAPGVVQHHLTAGGSVKVSEKSTIDFAVIHAFSNKVIGQEVTPLGPTPGTIAVRMNQWSASVGWKYKF